MDSSLLRVVIAAFIVALVALTWARSRPRLAAADRLLLDYTLTMYAATYAVGCVILFVFQTDYLYRYYGNGIFFPQQRVYWTVLLLAALPFAVVPYAVRMFSALVPARIVPARPPAPIRPGIKATGQLLVLVPSLAVVAPIAGWLLSNALGDLLSTSSAISLYTQRALVFQQVSFLQGGVIYSILPVVAATLLFWTGDHSKVSVFAGAALAVFATLLNLGMFQIGPTLAFFLTCALCYATTSRTGISLRLGAIALGVAIIGMQLYSTIKVTANQASQLELFLMRLPIPLPYLVQFASEKPATGAHFTSLPYDLGEYMFPELRSAQRFVAMPQPAFVDAWFSFNVLAGLAVLLLLGAMIVFFGRRLTAAGYGTDRRDPRLVLWTVVAAPTLYYAFQVDVIALFTSAYSITFVAMPTAAILIVHALMRDASHGTLYHSYQ